MESEIEEWRTIEDFPNYEVSNIGRCRRIGSSACLKPLTTVNGYFLIALYKNGIPIKRGVHRLVASAFIANPQNKPFVDHKNRKPQDNCVSNLRWASIAENTANSKKNNLLGFRGVYKNRKRYEASIRINKKLYHLGTYDTPEEAALMYDAAAIGAFGEFATLNFTE